MTARGAGGEAMKLMNVNARWLLAAVVAAAVGGPAMAADPLPPIKVSPDGHSFVKADGTPFFWQGDTAWCIFNHASPTDVNFYLDDRAEKGFNVIQGCVAVWDYRTRANPDGELPWVNGDPGQINEAFFKNVDTIIDKAARRGMYMAILPFWTKNNITGRNVETVESPEKMKNWCHVLAKRYAAKNVFWVLGGDAPGTNIQPLVDAEAAGLLEGAKEAGVEKIMITYHPTGRQSSSFWFQERPWLDFNSIQSGHFINTTNFQLVADDFAKKPTKPTLDMEPGYENITDRLVRDNPDAKRIAAVDVRRSAYLAVFAGAAGHTYGNGEVYEFYHPNPNGPAGAGWHANMDWKEALKLPGSGQIQHLRHLMESRPMLGRVPDQGFVVTEVTKAAVTRVEAIRAGDSSWAFVYFPAKYRKDVKQDVTIATGKLAGDRYKVWWFNPRTGDAMEGATFDKKTESVFGLPMSVPDNGDDDWVLVLDDVSKNYGPPGAHK
jgi:hypothetical protein